MIVGVDEVGRGPLAGPVVAAAVILDPLQPIEGLADSGALSDLQDAFHTRNSLQCGFCTAGMLMTAYELLQHVAHPSRQEIREYLAGNYCRCTGYEAIVDAIEQVATDRADNRQGDQRV